MKLKLKNPATSEGVSSTPSAPAATPTASDAGSGGGVKLKFRMGGASDAGTAQSEAPKQKRKYTKKPKVDGNGQALALKPKKRPREENGDDTAPTAKRKPKPTAKSMDLAHDSDENDDDAPPPSIPRPHPNRTQSVKLSFKRTPAGGAAPPRAAGVPLIKVKGAGKPPPRPPGVGYDSEAEEAEVDPAIEAQFILRMPPGPNCDILRKAIEEKTIGKSQTNGGPGVYFRFFDREGRRAMVTIQGRMYAASMVELPCVLESMKSWNKKDWVKTADVCQMLLVLGRVQSEDEAKKYPRPRDVEPDSHRYAHGLTPPMRWVRKRRFRPRKSYQHIEQIEAFTQQLEQDDQMAEHTKYEMVDSDYETSDESEEDAEGEDEDMDVRMVQTPAADAVDADDLMDMIHAGFMEDDVGQEANGGDDLFGDNTIEVATPATAHDVAMHALGSKDIAIIEPDTAASTPAGATSADDDDDDDADSDEDGEVDQEAAAKQQLIEQTRAELRELDDAIKLSTQQRDATKNVLMRKRIEQKIEKQMADKAIKLAVLGEGDD